MSQIQLNSGGGGGTPVETIDGDIGSATGSTITFDANTNCGSTVLFDASGSTVDLKVTDANQNTIMGLTSGNSSLSGVGNTGFGTLVFQTITTGTSNTAIGDEALGIVVSGNDNTAVGYTALGGIQTTSNNTAVGSTALVGNSGNNNTAIGASAAASLTDGSDNIIIGNSAGTAYTSTESSNIVIGNTGAISESNTIRIGNQGSSSGQQNTCFVAGIVGVTTSNSNFVTIDTTTGQLGATSGGGGGASLSPYIVGTTGTSDFLTIQAAINQAVTDGASSSSQANIYIKPGTYTEDLTLADGINLIGFTPVIPASGVNPSVVLDGTITCPGTLSASINSIRIAPSADSTVIFFTGGSSSFGTLSIINCVIVNFATSDPMIGFNTTSTSSFPTIFFKGCQIQLAGSTEPFFGFSGSGNTATMSLIGCTFSQSGTTASATGNNDFNVVIAECYLNNFLVDGSGQTTKSLSFDIRDCYVTTGNANSITTSASTNQGLTQYAQCTLAFGKSAPFALQSGQAVYLTNCILQGEYTATGGVCYLGGSSLDPSAGNGTSNVYLGGVGSIGNISIMAYAGDPNGIITAPANTLCLNTSGSTTTTRLFVNTNSGTTWAHFTSSA